MQDKNKDDAGRPVSPSNASAQEPDLEMTAAAMDERDGNADQADEADDVPERPISSDMQLFIGRQLRAVYDDVAKQPIPDRFLELMKQLEAKTTTS